MSTKANGKKAYFNTLGGNRKIISNILKKNKPKSYNVIHTFSNLFKNLRNWKKYNNIAGDSQ